jgi:hypothetical protein
MTHGQLASQSWCQALSGAQDQIFVTVKTVVVLLLWGTLSDERTGLSFTELIVVQVIYIYNFTCRHSA